MKNVKLCDNYRWTPSPQRHPSLRKTESILGQRSPLFLVQYKNKLEIQNQSFRFRNRTSLNLSKATGWDVKSSKAGTVWHLTSSVYGLVTTLVINTRRSSTKWRSGKYHLTGRTDKAYHHLGVGGALKQSLLLKYSHTLHIKQKINVDLK